MQIARLFMNPVSRWSFLLLTLCMVGCGGGGASDVTRYQVSGTATFKGQPIPSGMVYFEPDSVEGNKGPPGFAPIKDGQFDTSRGGKGTVGGAHVIRVEGYDGATTADQPYGKPIFGVHSFPENLPKEAKTLNIEVPEDAIKTLSSEPA